MAYQKNKPELTDRLSTSASDIQNNFEEIDTIIKVEHEEFGDPKQGKHKASTYLVQTSDPTTDGDSIALFCKNNGSKNTLHLKPLDNDTAIDIGSYSDNGSKGHTILPSGIIMNWGKFSMSSGTSSVSVTLSKAFSSSVFSVTYGAYMQVSSGTDVKNSTLAITSGFGNSSISFARYDSRDACTFHFIAIGI